jgi:tetratricopeptide (TPR) repeat protein
VLKRLDSIPRSRFGTAYRDMLRGVLHDDVPAADRAMRQWVAESPTSEPGAFLFSDVLLRENRPHELLDVVHRFDWRNAPPELLDGPPLYVLGALHFAGDYAGELREAQRRETLPNHGAWMSFLLAIESRALSALGRARELDPVFDRMVAISSRADIAPAKAMLASAEELMGHGHGAEAPAVLRRALQWINARTDTTSQAKVDLLHARVLYELGQFNEAQAIAAKVPRAGSPREGAPWALLGAIAARRGDRAEALRISSYLEPTPMNDLADHVERAQAEIAMALGDRERAMSHLLRACGRGCDSFLSFLESDYDLLALHGDPRFIALMRPKG